MRFTRREASRLIQKDKKRDYCAQMQGEGASATSFLRLPSMKIPRMLATLLAFLTLLFFAPDAFAARYLDELAAEVTRQAGKGD